MCHYIYHFKMYNSAVFSMFTDKFHHLQCLIPEGFITPERKPVPIPSHSTFLPSSGPRQPLTYFLSLWICLFWTFLIKGVM